MFVAFLDTVCYRTGPYFTPFSRLTSLAVILSYRRQASSLPSKSKKALVKPSALALSGSPRRLVKQGKGRKRNATRFTRRGVSYDAPVHILQNILPFQSAVVGRTIGIP